ncbi:MAG: sarcosine oxidase subunit gamma, partial [Gammaproteobacteria bacterium]|nr:sarcosine oxidase subunit gamma [Gammaproteobacteria bacterium]
MSEAVVLQSPLVGMNMDKSLVENPEITLSELPFRGHYNLRGSVDDSVFADTVQSVLGVALPVQPNTTAGNDAATIYWLSPDEWLLVTPDENDKTKVSAMQSVIAESFAKVTDISGGRTVIRIGGEKSLDLLARACIFDLHPRVFAAGQCAQTTIAKSPALIHKVSSDDNSHVVDIIVRRSFADYLWCWLE